MSYINEIILDVDKYIGRIRSGREICRARKLTIVRTEEPRAYLKQKLNVGKLTRWRYFQAISNTIGAIPIQTLIYTIQKIL